VDFPPPLKGDLHWSAATRRQLTVPQLGHCAVGEMKFATRRHVSRRVVADCLQIDHCYSETDIRGSSDYTATRSTSAPAGSVRRAGGDWRSRRGRRRSAIEARAGRVGWACGSRRMGLRVASDGPAGRVGWAHGSRRMGPRVA
jgi:hypothetical protein